MGIQRDNGGYSATIEGFLVIRDARIRLAKTNGSTFTLAEPCELSPGTSASLLVIVDGQSDSRQIKLPDGAVHGQMVVRYEVEAPF
jgi:hypothetical protein